MLAAVNELTALLSCALVLISCEAVLGLSVRVLDVWIEFVCCWWSLCVVVVGVVDRVQSVLLLIEFMCIVVGVVDRVYTGC